MLLLVFKHYKNIEIYKCLKSLNELYNENFENLIKI